MFTPLIVTSQIGGKRFHVDFVGAVAVERVTGRCAEFFEVDMIDAVADFFITGEYYTYCSMRNRFIFL